MDLVTANLEERRELLNKLRTKYREAGAKYGESYFCMIKLEERITHMVVNRLDFQAFLYAEFQFFQKLIDQAREEQEAVKMPSTENMDRILEKHLEMISHYPRANFSLVSTEEAEYFVGAITAYFPCLSGFLKDYFRTDSLWAEFEPLLYELERYVFTDGSRLKGALEVYAQHIRLAGNSDSARANKTLLMGAAKVLAEIYSQLTKLIDSLGESTSTIKLNRSLAEMVYFSAGMNIKEACQELRRLAQQIIKDFRLGTFFNLG